MQSIQTHRRLSAKASDDQALMALLADVLVKRPVTKTPFTAEARTALLEELPRQGWTTAREAYGWVWNHLGLRVSYLTVWRFLDKQGLLVGDKLRARRLYSVHESA